MGAAGAAGVGAVAGAGVDGAVEDEDEAVGAALGLGSVRLLYSCNFMEFDNLP